MSQMAVTGRAMESFVIEGARPLSGRIRAAGNKNGALPILAACLLTEGPVLARLRRASVPPPGGDVIGRRRLDPHIHALGELGARIESNGRYEMTTDGLRGTEIFLDEASVMATENTIMAASVTPGRTTIGNAA